MITKANYKKNCQEIAELFCKDSLNKNVCQSSVYERMIGAFTNETFVFFLSNINTGRFYLNQFNYSTWKIEPNTNGKKKTIQCRRTDVITGNSENQFWEYWNDAPNLDTADLNWLLNNRGWKLLDPSFPPSPQPPEVIEIPKLCYSWNEPSYGISYVPTNVGNLPPGTPPGSTPGSIIPTTPQIPGKPLTPGLDIKNILSNPIFLVGIGVVAFYLLKSKKII